MCYQQGVARRPLLARRDPRQSGFTLVEVLLTILIVGIMALIAVALYQRSARRFALQNEAITLATRLEQAKTLAQSESTEYRVLLNSSGYTPELINPRGSTTWVPADEISDVTIALSPNISYYDTSTGPQPDSGPITISPEGQPAGPPTQSTEIRFNSRGFPVSTGTPPTSPRQANAVYLTDREDFFAVTVSILGRVQVWAYNGSVWVGISR